MLKNKINLKNKCVNIWFEATKNERNYLKNQLYIPKSFSIKKIIELLLKFFPIPYGVLLGGNRYIWDKFFYLITKEKLKQTKWSINFQFKNEYLLNVEKYFDKDEFNQFKLVLSDKFFINPIKAHNLPSVFYGAPDNLFKEEFYHLLFINQKVNMIGIQHGGCTIEYAQNRFDEYDQNISDKMLYWGLGKKNIRQNRFNVNIAPFSEIQSFYLIEGLKPNVILKEFFGGSERIYKESEAKRVSLFDDGTIGIIKHPRSIQKDYSSFSSSIFMADMSLDRQKKSLFIMDLPFQTFMYKAIYQNLPFLMFINRDWQKWFTPNYSSFIAFLNKQKVLLYWDQEDEFVSRCEMIIETGEYGKRENREIINYLERKMN